MPEGCPIPLSGLEKNGDLQILQTLQNQMSNNVQLYGFAQFR